MNENIASEQYQGAPSVPEETTKSPQKLRAGKTSERPVFDAVVKQLNTWFSRYSSSMSCSPQL